MINKIKLQKEIKKVEKWAFSYRIIFKDDSEEFFLKGNGWDL
jgi:hypothetical protein